MTAKESSTWLAIINQEEALARVLYPNFIPPFASVGGSGSFSTSDGNEYDVEGGEDEPNFDVDERKPDTLLHPSSNIGMERMRLRLPPVPVPVPHPSFPMKGEAATSSFDFMRKRKMSGEFNTRMDQKIFTCEHSHCPYSEVRLGFQDRTSRDNHQLNCPYRASSSDYAGPSYHVNEVKPVIFPQSFVQPKPTAQSVNMVPPSIDLTGLGVPEDGQKMIGDLMTGYDTNVQGNNRVAAVENPNLPQPSIQPQHGSFYRSQGIVMGGNLFQETSMSNNHHMFARDEGQFDRFKALNSPFENHHNHNNNYHLMFGSHCDLTSFDFKDDMHGVGMDGLQKQPDISIWYQ